MTSVNSYSYQFLIAHHEAQFYSITFLVSFVLAIDWIAERAVIHVNLIQFHKVDFYGTTSALEHIVASIEEFVRLVTSPKNVPGQLATLNGTVFAFQQKQHSNRNYTHQLNSFHCIPSLTLSRVSLNIAIALQTKPCQINKKWPTQ